MDEVVYVFKDREDLKRTFETILLDSVKEVSDEYSLRRELGADIQFGQRYSDIH